MSLFFLFLVKSDGQITEQPLSKIAIHSAVPAFHDGASIKAYPTLLGLKGEDAEWVTVELQHSKPSNDDWIGVFSPAKFKFRFITNLCNILTVELNTE